MASISAKKAQVRLNAAAIRAYEWECNTDGGLWDNTSFEELGFEDSESGVRKARIAIKGFWDAAANIHANPPAIVDGITNINMLLYSFAVGSPAFTFPVYIIETVRVLAQVRDGLKFDFDSRNRGVFTYPGGVN